MKDHSSYRSTCLYCIGSWINSCIYNAPLTSYYQLKQLHMESFRLYGSILVQMICFVFFRAMVEDHFLYNMFSNMLYACRLVKHAAELHLLLEVNVMVLNSYMISMTYPKLNPSLFLQSIISSTT